LYWLWLILVICSIHLHAFDFMLPAANCGGSTGVDDPAALKFDRFQSYLGKLATNSY